MTNEEALEVLREKYIGIGANDLFVFRKAAEALEKQIPREPIRSLEVALNGLTEVFYCPVCTDVKSTLVSKLNYCPCCGQALKWGDE